MAVSISREGRGPFKMLDTEMAYHPSEYHGGSYPYGLCRDPYLSTFQPMANFGRMAWDFGVYSRDPYYQALYSFHAARGFGSPAFLPRAFKSLYADEEKPNQSYIGLIGQAIMSSLDKKMVLSDIYKWVLTHYAYFRNKGPGWKNSVRHNLSLNDCFVKAGRSPNGKGNFWAINPENYEDFRKGDFRRRRTQRRVRKSSQNVTEKDESPTGEKATSIEEISQCSSEKLRGIGEETGNGHVAMKEDVKVRTFDVENLLRVETE